MNEDNIRARLALAPRSPGVYLFKDSSDEVIYVGKAADLRNRVSSYFGGKAGLSAKVLKLVTSVADIEYILCGSEQEALVLEADLIRRYKPHFNARLKDDKSFPYLEVDLGSEWPRVAATRRRVNKSSLYFGPYASVQDMHQTLRLIRKMFPLRLCRGPLPTNRQRPCLNAYIRLCPGPCVGAADHDAYMQTVQKVVLFLQGKHTRILRDLEQEMKQAAERLDFELAAQLRDRFKAVQLITSRYEGAAALKGDQDILAVAQDGDLALVDIFSVREGRATGRQTFQVEDAGQSLPGDVLRGFILGYYGGGAAVPPLVLLQHQVEDSRLIASWLGELAGGAMRLLTPRSGSRKQLVDNVADSVARQLAGIRAIGGRGMPSREAGLKELKQVLDLPALPHRIEGYDISTIQGHEAVGSMVVFIDGVPKPSEYRRFRIRDIKGQNDFAMLAEVLRRRLSRMRAPTPSEARAKPGWAQQPALIMVDGGRGQLTAALEARAAFPACDVPMVSLAKEHEEVYTEHSPEPAPFAPDSPGLLILQALRDEAHRFAISYHRRLRGTSTFRSALDDIPGLGPRRKRALLLAYESISALRSVPAEEIAATCSMPLEVAQRLKEYLGDAAA